MLYTIVAMMSGMKCLFRSADEIGGRLGTVGKTSPQDRDHYLPQPLLQVTLKQDICVCNTPDPFMHLHGCPARCKVDTPSLLRQTIDAEFHTPDNVTPNVPHR